MKYLTSKEVADKWGVSLRSIQNYCSSGKIPGAQNLGKQWVIPADAVLPSDSRGKDFKKSVNTYIFPLFIFSPKYSFCDGFHPQEYALFSAELKMLEGENTESIRLCREILEYHAPLHVVMGAYYLIAHCSYILGNFYEYKKALTALEANLSPDDPHLEDYKLMLYSVKRPIGWNHRLFDDIDVSKLSSDALYLYQYECMLSSVVGGEIPSPDILHIIDALLSMISLEGIAPLDAYIRFPLAAFHFSSDKALAEELIDNACKTAISNNWYSIIAKNFPMAKMPIKKSLDKLGHGYYNKVAKMADRDYNNWRTLNKIASGVYPFENFGQSDISLLFMIYQGLSNSEICAVMGISSKELQDDLKNCYKTANVNNRAELKQYAVSQLSTWYES